MKKRILAAGLASVFLIGAVASSADARPFHDSNKKPPAQMEPFTHSN